MRRTEFHTVSALFGRQISQYCSEKKMHVIKPHARLSLWRKPARENAGAPLQLRVAQLPLLSTQSLRPEGTDPRLPLFRPETPIFPASECRN